MQRVKTRLHGYREYIKAQLIKKNLPYDEATQSFMVKEREDINRKLDTNGLFRHVRKGVYFFLQKNLVLGAKQQKKTMTPMVSIPNTCVDSNVTLPLATKKRKIDRVQGGASYWDSSMIESNATMPLGRIDQYDSAESRMLWLRENIDDTIDIDIDLLHESLIA